LTHINAALHDGYQFPDSTKWGQVSHFNNLPSFSNSRTVGGCLTAATTSRLTDPEWPIASRFAIHGLPAAVRSLSKQATRTLRPSPFRSFASHPDLTSPADECAKESADGGIGKQKTARQAGNPVPRGHFQQQRILRE